MSERTPIVRPSPQVADRIDIYVGAAWSHLTLAQAEAAHQQLGDAIAAVKAHQESIA